MGVGGSKGRGERGPRSPRAPAGGVAGRGGVAAKARAGHAPGAVNGSGAAKLVFDFPSSYEKGHDAQCRILDAAEKSGFRGESYFALRIALEEALVNAIRHGNNVDPGKNVHVEAKVSSKRVEILVEDEGPGFNRAHVPDPTAEENLEKCSGRGILLIESYMSKVRWDRGGRRLRMVRENRGE
ncbi:MAG TPA: ATP-binding protein [Tepidisphaeraceae bacterium]|jgi:serine/threonine-protein kinase RsbW|nr:ATP-binding protein [Tepidisphaeraceae bacterium]